MVDSSNSKTEAQRGAIEPSSDVDPSPSACDSDSIKDITTLDKPPTKPKQRIKFADNLEELVPTRRPSSGAMDTASAAKGKNTASLHSSITSITSFGDMSFGSSDGTSKPGSRSRQKSLAKSVRALYNRRNDESQRNIGYDDEQGRAEFFLLLLFESIGDSAMFFGGSILLILVWSIICAWGSQWLRDQAALNPGGTAERWVEDIESGKNALSVVGSLFVFTLVFRFNACYDRWWEARIFWGDMISKSIELASMNRTWIADEPLADRMSRFIILFSYASKALLRGDSLSEDGEDGPELVKQGLMTQEELDYMNDNPCWQPHYCLHVIREILFEAHSIPGGKGIRFDDSNKVHGQLFRCFDNTIKDLNTAIGNCIRVRSSGLPASYDAIVMMSFFAFFMLASVVWGMGIGWMAPIIIFAASMVIMFLIVMGTKLVDPFGTDKVDIPMEAFCATIEAQVYAIDERTKSGAVSRISKSSTPRGPAWSLAAHRLSSARRISKSLTAR